MKRANVWEAPAARELPRESKCCAGMKSRIPQTTSTGSGMLKAAIPDPLHRVVHINGDRGWVKGKVDDADVGCDGARLRGPAANSPSSDAANDPLKQMLSRIHATAYQQNSVARQAANVVGSIGQ